MSLLHYSKSKNKTQTSKEIKTSFQLIKKSRYLKACQSLQKQPQNVTFKLLKLRFKNRLKSTFLKKEFTIKHFVLQLT